jgi:branched-chain amino acid transport system substrate-binding protein
MAAGLATALILTAALAAGCGGPADSTVYLASVGPEDRIQGEFNNGITMALEEIEKENFLNGTAVKIEYFDDKRDLTTGIRIAQELAKQKDKYTAVIGHWNASINIPAATIYNAAALLDVTPMVSSPELTIPAKQYIFRMVTTDADEAERIAQYASEKGYRNIAVCYADSDYGRGLCDVFETFCGGLGLNIIDTHINFVNQAEFDRQYKKWKALNVDAVFLADSLPSAVDAVNLIRGKDASLPILSAGGFSFDDVVALVGEKNSNSIAFVSLYDPEQDLDSLKEFNAKYKEKFGEDPPSFLASRGYECIWLIANAVKETGSKSSKDVAGYLRTMPPWKGVYNTYQYKENGDLDAKGIEFFVVEVNGGTYTYLQ